MTTISDILKQIAVLRAKKAVLQSLTDYVQTNYFAPENAEPDQQFETEEGAPIPQGYVLEAMGDLVDKAMEYDLEIRRLESLEIAPPALPASPAPEPEPEEEDQEPEEESEGEEDEEEEEDAPAPEPETKSEEPKEKRRGKAQRDTHDRSAA